MNPLKFAATLIMTQRCPFCSEVIEPKEITCTKCRDRLLTDRIPILSGASGYRCVSSFFHRGSVRKMILNVKYNAKIQFLPQVAEILADDIRKTYTGYAFDLITSVPMFRKTQIKRGYNQAAVLARALSKELSIPYQETLIKIKDTPQQQSLTGKKRRENLKGAFRVIDPEITKGKNILLVDDVITTGSTLSECCKMLAKTKTGVIACATIAKTNSALKEKQEP